MHFVVGHSCVHKRLRFAAFSAALLALLLSCVGELRAFASCQVTTVSRIASDPAAPTLTSKIVFTAAPISGLLIAREGLTERLSDILIYDSGSGTACFTSGNVLSVNYSLPITVGPQFDVFDKLSALSISTSTTSTSSASTVKITITKSGTPGNLVTGTSGAAIRIKNVRGNATTVGAGINAQVTITGSLPGTLGTVLWNVGLARNTIDTSAITKVGAGAQNYGGTLSTHASFSFTENFIDALRVGSANSSGVAGDIPTGATSLVLDFANTVPLGVTVTFPPQIVSGGLTLSRRSGGICQGPFPCFAVYDTASNSPAAGTVSVTTAAVARTGEDGSVPALGVQIGELSAAGAAVLRVLLGPGIDGDADDDVRPDAVPRYLSNSSPGSQTRLLTSGNFFVIAPSAPIAALSPASLIFNRTLVGQSEVRPVVITNSSTTQLQIAALNITGTGYSSTDTCGTLLAPLSSCVVQVTFAPQSEGSVQGALTMFSNATGSPHRVVFDGTGVVQNPVPKIISISPNTIQAGSGTTPIVITGSGFAFDASVLWNGKQIGSAVISSTQITAGIPAAELTRTGSASITVQNSAPGGGISLPAAFTVVSGPMPSANYLYYVPHLVSGDGFATTITLVDVSNHANNVTLNSVAQNGALLDSRNMTLAPGATVQHRTPESERAGASTTKWAIVGSDGPLAIHVLLEGLDSSNPPRVTNSVGYSECSLLNAFSFSAHFDLVSAAPRTIGLALANPGGDLITVSLQLVDQSGRQVAYHDIALSPFAQSALDLGTVAAFKPALDKEFVGSITGAATAPVCGLALFDNRGPFSAVPIAKRNY